MAGTNLGFLNFGIGGEDKELRKKIEGLQGDADKLQKTLLSLDFNPKFDSKQLNDLLKNQQKTSVATANDITKSLEKVSKVDLSSHIEKYLSNLKEVRSNMSVLKELMSETQNSNKKLEIVKEYKEASEEAEKLMRKIEALEEAQTRLKSSGSLVPTRAMGDDRALQQMADYYKQLEKSSLAHAKAQAQAQKEAKKLADIRERSTKKMTQDEARENAKLLADQEKKTQKAESLAKRTADAQQRASERVRREQQRIEEAVGMTNKTMFSQKEILNQMSNALGIYFSIYQAGRFVKELAMVSGEFEKQRLSLAAIIQDGEASKKIFNQIKDLAVYSPFNFSELTSYAKQLSAFSIPTNEIFETMTKLADVSAGLGVDMNRIILAYGQVRSASVLRGQELRQFTEAGIPLVDELAKKFQKLTREVVSAGDVFDKISNREVPFAMIKEIFEDMTSEGGKFYKMQEIQATSLAGKISNLRDAYDIMLDSIGGANSDLLKGGVDGIIDLLENWKNYWKILKTIIVAYGSYRAVIIATTVAQKGLIQSIRTLAIAQTMMASLSKINPYALALAGITALIGGFVAFINTQEEAEEKLLASITVINNQAESVNKLVNRLKELTKENEANKNSERERSEILAQLLQKEPELANAIKDHADSLEVLIEVQERYNTMMDARKFAAYAVSETGGVFSNDIVENLTDMAKAQNVADMSAVKLDITYTKLLETIKKTKEVGGVPTNLGVIAFAPGREKEIDDILASQKSHAEKVLEVYQLVRVAADENRRRSSKYRVGGIADTNLYNQIFTGDHKENMKEYSQSLWNLSQITDKTNAELSTLATTLETHFRNKGIDVFNKEYEDELRQFIKSLETLDEYGKKEILAKWNIEFEMKGATKSSLDGWRKELQDILGNTITIQIDSNLNDITKQIGDEHQKLKDRVEMQKPILIKYGFDVSTGKFPSPLDISESMRQMAEGFVADTKDMSNLEKAVAKLGYSMSDLNKSKDKGKTEDKFTKTLKEEVDLIKEARSEYDKLLKLMSADQAGIEIKGIDRFKGIDVSSLTDSGYEAYLKEQLGKIEKRNTDSAKSVRETWNKELGQIEISEITEKAKNEVSKIEKYLSQYKEKYNLYEQIFSITGDKGQASKVAFGTEDIFSGIKDQMLREFGKGNVDLLTRPLIDGAELVKKGWEDAGNGIATVFSSQYGIKDIDGNIRELLVTPILPNGDVLSPQELENYIHDTLEGASDILSSDKKGIVIALDVDKDGKAGEKLHQLQEDYYGLNDAVFSHVDALKSAFGASADVQSYLDIMKSKFEELSGFSYAEFLGKGDEAQQKVLIDENLRKLFEQIEQSIQAQNFSLSLDSAKLIADYQSITDKITAIENNAKAERSKYEKAGLLTPELDDSISKKKTEQIDKLKEELFTLTDYYRKIFGDMSEITFNGLRDMVLKGEAILKSAVPTYDKDGKQKSYTVSVDDKQYEANIQAFERFRKKIVELRGDVNQNDPFSAIADNIKKLKSEELTLGEFAKVMSKNLSDIMGIANEVGQSLSAMFSALGDEASADTIGFVLELGNAFTQMSADLASGNPIQQVTGVIKGVSSVITSIAGFHDKKLDRAIKRSQLEVKKLGNAYANIERTISRQLGAVSKVQAKGMVENQEKQIEELENQLAKQRKKKKGDKGAEEDLKGQIAEARDQLRYFYEDLAGEQWGINIKDYAGEIASSLVDAFSTGADAAEAFDNTVANIMRNIVGNMLQLQILEPAMKKMREYLFGTDGKGGVLGDGELSEQDAIGLGRELADLKGSIGKSKDLWDAINGALDGSLEDVSSKDTLSKGIQALTEDTGHLLGSYINAIRADVSRQRAFIEQLVAISGNCNDIFAQQLAELKKIEVNTYNTATNTLDNVTLVTEMRDIIKNLVLEGSGVKLNI